MLTVEGRNFVYYFMLPVNVDEATTRFYSLEFTVCFKTRKRLYKIHIQQEEEENKVEGESQKCVPGFGAITSEC